MANNTWLTTSEAAAMAGRDASTIRHWIKDNLVTVKRQGRDNLVSRRSVEKMIAKLGGRWTRTAEAN